MTNLTYPKLKEQQMSGKRYRHGTIADLLGLSVSTLSRYRSQTQEPSIESMELIEDRLGWTVVQQFTAKLRGTWAPEFETRIRTWVDENEPDDDDDE